MWNTFNKQTYPTQGYLSPLTLYEDAITAELAREIIRWKGVLGLAKNADPYPEGVTFEEATSSRPISKRRV